MPPSQAQLGVGVGMVALLRLRKRGLLLGRSWAGLCPPSPTLSAGLGAVRSGLGRC